MAIQLKFVLLYNVWVRNMDIEPRDDVKNWMQQNTGF